MRAWLVLGLLLAPALVIAQSPASVDIIVLLRSPSALPTGAIPLSILDGYVLLDAPASLAESLASRPEIARVQIASPIALASLPAAPGPALSSHLIRTDDASVDATGRGITVAIVDTGVDATHPDLAQRVLSNLRIVDGVFVDAPGDTSGHGTHVAGIVGASGASANGWHGVAPAARFVGLDLSSHFTTATALLAYDWLYTHHTADGIRVVVNAWGRVGAGEPFDPQDAEIQAIDKLVDSGVVVVFSASNHGPGPSTLSLEAQDPRVITVGATDAIGQVPDYSSRGPVVTRHETWVKPDVVAPGDRILSLKSQQAPPDASDPDPLHRTLSGTSQAAPHVAGLVALMLEANDSLTPDDVRARLVASAIDVGPPGPDDESGYGLVDAPDALRLARGAPLLRDHPLYGGRDHYAGTADVPTLPGGPIARLLARPQTVWTKPFAVLPGATSLDVQVLARGSPMDLTLTRDGRAQATWTSDGAQIRGRLEEPEPGEWALEISGIPAAATHLDATLDVHLRATSIPPDPSYRAPDPPRFATRVDDGGAALMDAIAAHPVLLWGAIGALAGVALLVAPRRKRPEASSDGPA